jgi:hypothetical protein
MDEQTRPTTATDDSWAVLALPAEAAMRHVRLLEALRTFRPHPETGTRSVEQDRLAAAAGLHLDTLRQARAELVKWGVIAYQAGRGRGSHSEYWIRPVPPEKVDAPKPLIRGSHRPPFYVPAKRGVAIPKKGGDPSLKRGVAKSSDQQQREHKRTTSREQEKESLSRRSAPLADDDRASKSISKHLGTAVTVEQAEILLDWASDHGAEKPLRYVLGSDQADLLQVLADNEPGETCPDCQTRGGHIAECPQMAEYFERARRQW